MITKYGDIFTTDARAIGHGVNCKGKMGAGIAVLFAKRFGEDYVKEYAYGCENGHITPGGVHIWDTDNDDQFDLVFNIASQNELGRDAREAWLTSALHSVAMGAVDEGIDRVAIPAIGCGIGGLHLDALERAIDMSEKFVNNEMQFELWLFEG